MSPPPPFRDGFCCVASGQRLHLKNDCGCQSRLISQPSGVREGWFPLTNTWPQINVSTVAVNDDSIRESQACVSLPYHFISFTLAESLLCLSGMIQILLVSMVLISSGEMESAWQPCRVRWHWVADLTLITTTLHLFPSLLSFFSPPSHPFLHKLLHPFLWFIYYFPWAVSYFPCLSSMIYLFVFDYFLLSVQCIFGNNHPGIFWILDIRKNNIKSG